MLASIRTDLASTPRHRRRRSSKVRKRNGAPSLPVERDRADFLGVSDGERPLSGLSSDSSSPNATRPARSPTIPIADRVDESHPVQRCSAPPSEARELQESQHPARRCKQPWRDHARKLGVAEFVQQSPDVPIDRLFPDLFAAIEVTTDRHAIDARINGPTVKREQAPFADPKHPDRQVDSSSRLRRSNWSTAANTFWTS